jgi:hypothetical protein
MTTSLGEIEWRIPTQVIEKSTAHFSIPVDSQLGEEDEQGNL